jgi:hypothetical protein
MRFLAAFVFLAACATDPTDAAQAVVTRSHLENSFDDLLAASNVRGCDIEDGRQVCILTTAVSPPRVLQIGDAIPSPSTLEHCSGGVCAGFVAKVPPASYSCPGLSVCGSLSIGCAVKGGETTCHPVQSPLGGTTYHCNCSE